MLPSLLVGEELFDVTRPILAIVPAFFVLLGNILDVLHALNSRSFLRVSDVLTHCAIGRLTFLRDWKSIAVVWDQIRCSFFMSYINLGKRY